METSVFRSTLYQELSTICPAVFEITGVNPGPIFLNQEAWSQSGEEDMP